MEISWQELAERYKRLYVPAVADVLDEKGLWFQVVHRSIRPLEMNMKIAGPAFTILGQRNRMLDRSKRMGPKIIDKFTPGVIAMYDTLGDEETGHWGELWSNGAVSKGCAGAVIDGGIRDTAYIQKINFPIFSKYICANDAHGRFNIIDYQCQVHIGNVPVNPGDYVFGDCDGVVIIPKELTVEVLLEAEKVVHTENKIREEVMQGESLGALYKKYGRF